MKPLITLLITTRERAIRLEKCLATCVGQDWDQCELLISDNVSTDNTVEVIERYRDRLPIRYINPGRRLGMAEHWEFAIPQALGEYLCVIGDDDGLPSWGLRRMKELLSEYPDVDAISWHLSTFYYPGLPDPAHAGIFNHHGGDIVQLRSAHTTLSLLFAGNHGYSELPGAYHKLTKTSLIQKIASEGILGVAPDMSIASVVSATIADYLYTRTPLTIPGNSPSGNGFATLSPKGDKQQASMFLKETSVPIAAPFNGLSFKFESNWHLMQLETIVKLKRKAIVSPDFRINYIEHLRQVRAELTIHSEPPIGRFDDDLWTVYSGLAKESDAPALSREFFLREISKSSASALNCGMGPSPYFRVTLDYPDISAAMPLLEEAIHEAGVAGQKIIKDIIPIITDAVSSRSFSRALLFLPQIQAAFGGDVLYLAISPPDLAAYLTKYFPSEVSSNHSYSLTLSFYLLFTHIESDPAISSLLEKSLTIQNAGRFASDREWIESKSWKSAAAIYRHAGTKLRRLDSLRLLWAAPLLLSLKSKLLQKTVSTS